MEPQTPRGKPRPYLRPKRSASKIQLETPRLLTEQKKTPRPPSSKSQRLRLQTSQDRATNNELARNGWPSNHRTLPNVGKRLEEGNQEQEQERPSQNEPRHQPPTNHPPDPKITAKPRMQVSWQNLATGNSLDPTQNEEERSTEEPHAKSLGRRRLSPKQRTKRTGRTARRLPPMRRRSMQVCCWIFKEPPNRHLDSVSVRAIWQACGREARLLSKTYSRKQSTQPVPKPLV
mmetsp:Transcript_9166/g.24754  ORF Transcript_9166/g.24754 Transcript_9166/m.24754 type:complete len:232 (+) Transcript_9166:426-1121(+)